MYSDHKPEQKKVPFGYEMVPSYVYDKNPFYDGDHIEEAKAFQFNKHNAFRNFSIKNSAIFSNRANKAKASISNSFTDGQSKHSHRTPVNAKNVDEFMYVWGYGEDWRLRITNFLRPDMVGKAEQLLLEKQITNKLDPPFTWDALAGTKLEVQGIELPGAGTPHTGPRLPWIYVATDHDPKENPYLKSVVIKSYGLHYTSEWISWFITQRPTRKMHWSMRTFKANRAEWRKKALGTPNDKITSSHTDISGDLSFYGIAIDVPFDIDKPESSGWKKGDFSGRIMAQALFLDRLETMEWTIIDGKKMMVVEAILNSASQYDKFVNTFVGGTGNNGTMESFLKKTVHKFQGIFQNSDTPFVDLIDHANNTIAKYNPSLRNNQHGDPSWALLIPGTIISKHMREDKNQLHLYTGSNIFGLKHMLERPRRKFYRIRDTLIFDVDLYRPVEKPDPIQLFQCFKQDVIFNYFPIDNYVGKGYRYDREGVIYVTDGENGVESPVRLKDFVQNFKKHFNATNEKQTNSVMDFVKLFTEGDATPYLDRALDGMFSEIMRRYPKAPERTLTAVITRLKELISNEELHNLFISFGASPEAMMFEVFGYPRSKYAYIWNSIRDLITKVANIAKPFDEKILHDDSPWAKTTSSDAVKAKRLEMFKLSMFIALIGKGAFEKLMFKSPLAIKDKWNTIVNDQAHMPSYIRTFFAENKDHLEGRNGEFTKTEIEDAVDNSLRAHTNLMANSSGKPSVFLRGMLESIPFSNGDGLDVFSNNNIMLPGRPCFIRTMVSVVDTAGYAKKGALELLLGPPRSYIQTDVEHATATFVTEMPCGVAPIDENGYLRVDHVNYGEIRQGPTTRFWERDQGLKSTLLKRYEGLIIPFIVTEAEWRKAKGRNVLPIKEMWNIKYRKHANNEIFCRESCFVNSILKDFGKMNKMSDPRHYFNYFRNKETHSGMVVTGNMMYQGYQSAYDTTRGIHCTQREQTGPLRGILNHHYKKKIPERLVRFSNK